MRRAVTVLAATSLVTAGLFVWNRSRSPFLAAERELATAQQLAVESSVPVSEVLALREGAGVELGAEPWRARAQRWSQVRARWDLRELAVLELLGSKALAEDLARRSGGEASRLAELLRSLPEQVGVRRFLTVAERFASRLQARS